MVVNRGKTAASSRFLPVSVDELHIHMVIESMERHKKNNVSETDRRAKVNIRSISVN